MSHQLINFSWVEPKAVAGMAFPSAAGLMTLEASGVHAVLTLTERGIPSVDGIAQHHEPLIDFGTPSFEQLNRCVAWIDEQRAQDRGVVVHCMAGIGRTGTVIAAWLISQGQTATEAIEQVRRLRPGSIETDGQAAVLHAFANARESSQETDA